MMRRPLEKLSSVIVKRIPSLAGRLRLAGIAKTPEQFMSTVILSSFYATAVIVFSVALIIAKTQVAKTVLLVITPIIFLFLCMYFMQLPTVKQKVAERALEKEIVFATRFMIIEIQSGVPLYSAFHNISEHYPAVGGVFRQIVHSIDLGSPMEDALDEAIEYCASQNVRRVLLQIKNSLQVGADVSVSLQETARQITAEQMILVKEYGRKLNPFVMFFMMIAVIMPSLGATAFVVLGSFLNISVDLTFLMIFVGFLAFTQFIFFNLIKTSRPPVDYD